MAWSFQSPNLQASRYAPNNGKGGTTLTISFEGDWTNPVDPMRAAFYPRVRGNPIRNPEKNDGNFILATQSILQDAGVDRWRIVATFDLPADRKGTYQAVIGSIGTSGQSVAPAAQNDPDGLFTIT